MKIYNPIDHGSNTSNWDYIPLLWCVSNNMGDALNYWLVNKITNKPVVWVPKESTNYKFVCIGSILNWADGNCGVWGAGLANQTDTVNPGCQLHCVRGPISASIAIESGKWSADTVPLGDPALLVPKYYKGKKAHQSIKVGIIPHYADFHALNNPRSPENSFAGIAIINVFDPIEKIVDEIKKCQVILSSSLHGLILADAYGIPNKQIKITDYVLGDGTKFADYLLSVNRTYRLPTNFCRIRNYDQNTIVRLVKDEYEPINLKDMQEALLTSCPFS